MPEKNHHLSDLAARAQALLFVEGGSLPLTTLKKLLKTDQKSLHDALTELAATLQGSGLSLIETEREVSLATSPHVTEAVHESLQESLERDIGEAGLEVLAIVLYSGASTRAQIDYIRGVNTSSTIRTLLSRGLLDRASNPEDAREYLYRPTVELLAHLGVSESSELPDYATIRAELAAFENTRTAFGDHDDTGDMANA